jgi:hypothetical protein
MCFWYRVDGCLGKCLNVCIVEKVRHDIVNEYLCLLPIAKRNERTEHRLLRCTT